MSLVEVLLVVATVGLLTLMLANLPNSFRLVSYSGHQSLAREVAIKSIEDIRQTPYANLSNGDVDLADPRIRQLPSGSGTKSIADCDPTVCTQGEIAKQVTITISWKENGSPKNLVIKTLVTDGGLK